MSGRYYCRVGTPDGRVLEQAFEAANESAARKELEGKGYHIFEIRRRGVPLKLALPKLGLRKRALGDRQFLVFNQELAGLLRAGLPLLQALDLMLERQPEGMFRTVLSDIRDKVKAGEELSSSFSAHGDLFPPLYASTLKAGERSGDLEQVIRRFIRYMRLVMNTKKRVVSALVYPTVLLGLSIAMIGVMTIYVIPRFEGFYEAMDIDLPFLTQVILDFSLFLHSLFTLRSVPFWIAAAAIGYFVAARSGASGGLLREWFDRAKLRIPIVGGVLLRFSLSEFCRSVATLINGGMPLVPALEVAVGAVGNVHLRNRLSPLVPRVREGRAFHLALDEAKVFTPLAIDMVKVGEATGALDEMMSSVSDFFDEEVETRLERLLSLVEPLMLVFMGLAVAILLAAMYLPLFTILGQLQ